MTLRACPAQELLDDPEKLGLLLEEHPELIYLLQVRHLFTSGEMPPYIWSKVLHPSCSDVPLVYCPLPSLFSEELYQMSSVPTLKGFPYALQSTALTTERCGCWFRVNKFYRD